VKVVYIYVPYYESSPSKRTIDYYVLKLEISCEEFSQEVFKIIRLCEEFQKKGNSIIYSTKSYVGKIIVEIQTKECIDMNEAIKCCENVTYQMMGIDSDNPAIKFLSMLWLKYF
jgi:hypothetical protein